ncbi:MAG: histidine phosphatase family protein [Pseudorhodoplanes sp.]
MRRLMLLRHAKSDWSEPGGPDRDRVLSPRGEHTAPLIGRYLAEQDLLPQHAIVSAAERTRQTWELLGDAVTGAPSVRFDERIYEAAPIDILDAIADAPAAAQSVMVVGHNPGLQSLALALTGTGNGKARRALAEKFPTAGLAIIDFDLPDWKSLAPASGRLERFITPRAIGGDDD